MCATRACAPVQAGVLDRGRGAQREVLGEREVVLVEAAAAVGGDERDRAERLARRRASARSSPSACRSPADRLQLLGVVDRLRRAARPGCRGSSSAGPPRSTAGDARRRVRVGRVAAAQLLAPARPSPGRRGRARPARSPPSGPGMSTAHQSASHGTASCGDALQRLLRSRGSRRAAGRPAARKRWRSSASLASRDVLDDVDREAAALVFAAASPWSAASSAPGALVDAAGEQLRRGLARDQPAAGEVLDARPASRPRW